MKILPLALAAFLAATSALAADLPTPNRGTVAETLGTNEYIYIRVKTAKGEEWLAAPQQELAPGTPIAWSEGAAMPNFRSHRLNRNFDLVTFVDVVVKTR